jgi:hypothetical protein
MPKASSLDTYKVPAYQRKRSLSAKARRVCKPVTALERMKAGVPFVKKKVTRRRRVARSSYDYDEPVSYERPSYESPSYERQDTFSQPLLGADSYNEPSYREEPSHSSSSGPAFREMRLCGKVSGYLNKIEVAIVEVSSSIRAGDKLIFESEYGLFEQTVDSMQINHENVVTAYSGDSIGLKVFAEPKNNGNVYKVM